MTIGAITADRVAKKIAKRCVELREQHGLSLQDVADRAELSKSQAIAYLTNQSACAIRTAAVSIPATGTPAGFEFSGLPLGRGLLGLLRWSTRDLAHSSPEGVTRPVCAQFFCRLNEFLALGFAFVSGFALRHWASCEGVSLSDLLAMREARHG
jgi:hypothetical protein